MRIYQIQIIPLFLECGTSITRLHTAGRPSAVAFSCAFHWAPNCESKVSGKLLSIHRHHCQCNWTSTWNAGKMGLHAFRPRSSSRTWVDLMGTGLTAASRFPLVGSMWLCASIWHYCHTDHVAWSNQCTTRQTREAQPLRQNKLQVLHDRGSANQADHKWGTHSLDIHMYLLCQSWGENGLCSTR